MSLDDAEKYDGGPAAIQLFGRRFEEEKLLAIARVVVEVLKTSGELKVRGEIDEGRYQ